MRADNEVLRQSFGTIAEGYDRLRPGPPDEAVRLALPDDAVDVLELGAGTGGLTRQLVRCHRHVRAVEPDARMRAVVLEVARVLRAGGTFALLWNGVDRSVDWVRSLWAGGEAFNPRERSGVDAVRRARHEVHLGPDDPFLAPERQVIRWTRLMSQEDLVGMAGTYSAVIVMEPVQRREYLASIARFLDTHEVPRRRGAIEVPMRCLCWRTSRR